MISHYKPIAGLIIKHRKKTISNEEKIELEHWCRESKANQTLFNNLQDDLFIDGYLKDMKEINIEKEFMKLKGRIK